MASLADIEQTFEELKRNLRGATSVRRFLKELDDFVRLFEQEDDRIESYLLELADRLPQLDDSLSITGIDPGHLNYLLGRLESARSHFSTLENHYQFETFIDQLQHIIALQYAFTGEPVKAIDVLDLDLDEALQIRLEQWLAQTEDHPYHLLRECIRMVREVTKKECAPLNRLKEQWDQCRNPNEESDWTRNALQSVLIPTVEEIPPMDENEDQPGRLRRLSIELFEVSKKDVDHFTTNFLQQNKGREDKILEAITSAARVLLEEDAPSMAKRGFRGRFSFTHPHWSHRGESLQLAAAGLLYGAVQYKTYSRYRYKLKTTAAITGRMDKQGQVRQVDARGLAAKVEAAFFSWAEVLVVPDSQRSLVREEVERLRERYPNRSLEFFGVNRLRDLFYDRRVSLYQEDTLPRYYGRKMWRLKVKIAAGLLIPALAILSLYLYIGPLNQNPASVSIDGNNFVIKNKYGRILTRLPAGMNLKKETFRQTIVDPHGMIKLRDITGDGIRDIFWFRRVNSDTLETSLLTALNYRTGEQIWQKKLTYRFDFEHKRDPHPNRFLGTQIKFLESKQSDSLQMLILGRHINYFPSVVARLNPYTGERREFYLNFGFLRWMTLMDLDDNGRKEILVTGETNAWEQPVVAVLDPFLMEGHAPTTEEYRIRNMKKAVEIAYWRMPKTRVSKISDRIRKWHYGKKITMVGGGESFKVIVNGRVTNKAYSHAGSGWINLIFNTRLKLEGVATTDLFDQVVEKLQQENRLGYTSGFELFHGYADSLYYWNGSGWQHEPVINPHYIQKRKFIKSPSYQWSRIE